jgi:predicted permease
MEVVMDRLPTTRSSVSFRLFLETIIQETRYSLRSLQRSPVLTIAVTLTLALGIGANTAIFTLIDAVMLQMLPVAKPDQLYVLGKHTSMTRITGDNGWQRHTSFLSYPLYQDLRRNTDVFSNMAAFASYPVYTYLSPEQPIQGAANESATVRLVSGSFFATLGVPAIIGRTIGDDDNRDPGGHPVVVLSHAFWQRRFGGSTEAIGHTISLSGVDYTIIGVAAADFSGVLLNYSIDMWAPMAMQAQLIQEPPNLDDREVMWLRVIGRRHAGITAELAQTRTNQLFRRMLAAELGSEISPETRAEIAKMGTELVPFGKGFSYLRQRYEKPLQLLMVVVGLVLLIACANVSNLLLSRASRRQQEVALRMALGSSRTSLLRQLLIESLLLALLGGAAGLLVASGAIKLLTSMASAGNLPDTSLDLRVLLFTFGVSIVTALIFGLAPARRATRIDLNPTLRRQNVASSSGGLRKLLVITQVGMSLLLLIGAGLFLRSLDNLRSQDLGYRSQGLLQVEIDPQGGGYSQEQLPGLYRDLRELVNSLPGVESTSLSMFGVLEGGRWVTQASVDGFSTQSTDEQQIEAAFITPSYFETIGASLLAGRAFTEHDRSDAPQVAVVNQAFAQTYFGDSSPLGKRFGTNGDDSSRDFEIVGLVADLKSHNLWDAAPQLAYFPVAQNVQFLTSLQVRCHLHPATVAGQLRQTLNEAFPNLPVYTPRTLPEEIERSLRQERTLSQLTGLFSLPALLLAAIGLYGVLADGVTQRTREIGVRIALGAQTQQVQWMVLRNALTWVVLGAGIGMVAALLAGRLVTNLLFGLAPTDLVTTVLATLALLLVSAVASYWPARRASRLDPIQSLRYE